MRLLVLGHWSDTGFGVVTRNLATRFVEAGVDVRVLAVNHRGEPIRGPLSGRVWPTLMFGQPYGGNLTDGAISGALWDKLDRADDWTPEAVLAITDTGGLFGHLPAGVTDTVRSVPFFHYCPIEGDRLSLGWRGVWQHITPVAMSDYGARVIGEHIGREITRIYHGVDSDAFRPVALNDPLRVNGQLVRSKEECKAAFGLDPARQVILRTDRNVTRKFYYLLLEAFTGIAAAVPDVDLVLHCQPRDPHDGLNMIEDIARMPAEFQQRVKFTNAHDTFTGLPTEGLVALMNAADVYVSTTGGEGFGLTLAESLACEVPVVVTDWAADAETVGPGGVLVPPLMDRYGEPVRFHSAHGMDWALPDARGFVEPVVDLLTHPARRRAFGKLGRLHVTRSFSWDRAADEFLHLFAQSLAVGVT